MSKDILLTVDYHDRACVIRRYDHATRREQLFTEVLTTKEDLLRTVDQARRDVGRRGCVTWIQESTTGWARVKELLEAKVEFVLANIPQMPLPPGGWPETEDRQGWTMARMQRGAARRNLAVGLLSLRWSAASSAGWWLTARGW